ncbi:MAG: phospholipid/cholesterol/gamma-HCH transport system substrate-binding protein [Thermoleophilaceae bacterium]|jgi:phospholipid/cholesterol/gamma-HCH transport system substrate-binding protein|nr:phospholipid/cholesterol/gamma-HCH transport system substrate-binding protein [Thermoleophilaceae bacterium]
MFGGGETYKVRAVFQNAGQLVRGNEVRVGGQPIGTITDIELDDSAQAVVTMQIEEDLAPLHDGTTATIRSTSLSGIANRYVSLEPGPNSAREIADGGRIGADDTSAPVDLDVLFNTLDADTREGLRNLVRGSGDWYDGRGADAAASTKYFAPFLGSTTRLTEELALDQALFERFVTDGAATVSAIAERRDDLAALVGNTSQAMDAIADESVALQRALELLPGTLRKANTTFVNLRGTLDDLEVLVKESKPATRELAPFFRELRPLVAEARPTIADLSNLIRKPGPSNDLTELTAKQPRLAQLTASVFPRAIRALDRSQPVIEYARLYTPDLAGWLTKFGQVAGYYDANGHYARVQPVFAPTVLSGGSLVAVPPERRLEGFERGILRHCPGSAVQPPPDGSAPIAAEGCDPADTPPGP